MNLVCQILPAEPGGVKNAQIVAEFTDRKLRRRLDQYLSLSDPQRLAMQGLWHHGRLMRVRATWEVSGCIATAKTISCLCDYGLVKIFGERIPRGRFAMYAELRDSGVSLMRAVDQFNSIRFHNLAEVGMGL